LGGGGSSDKSGEEEEGGEVERKVRKVRKAGVEKASCVQTGKRERGEIRR